MSKSARRVSSNNNKASGFTIIELLVVVVIIGILAAITIVSYRSLSARANEAAILSDLANAKKQFELYKIEHGFYPTGFGASNCLTGSTNPTPDTKYCLKSSIGGAYGLVYSGSGGSDYILKLSKNDNAYSVSDNTSPRQTVLAGPDWIDIGKQTWSKSNLNVGTMITGANEPSNNSIIEKYCYSDIEANCIAKGAIYEWSEAMNYASIEGAQGICPVGSHIPTDAEWKILEMQLGMSQVEADKSDVYRGTDQGTQLKPGGASGMNILTSGYRGIGGGFGNMAAGAYSWSSSTSGALAWYRSLDTANVGVSRNSRNKAYGFSIRCLGN